MSEYREAALSFEAVKIGMTQNKDGIILRLAVHPQECPPSCTPTLWVSDTVWL